MNVSINSMRIEQLAAKKNLPRKAIAIDTGINYSSLTTSLNRGSMRLYSACLIANVLGVDVSEIIAEVPLERKCSSYAFDIETIRHLMGASNMNDSDLARKCGYSRQRINQLFKKGSCSFPVLCNIANALCVTEERLLA